MNYNLKLVLHLQFGWSESDLEYEPEPEVGSLYLFAFLIPKFIQYQDVCYYFRQTTIVQPFEA